MKGRKNERKPVKLAFFIRKGDDLEQIDPRSGNYPAACKVAIAEVVFGQKCTLRESVNNS